MKHNVQIELQEIETDPFVLALDNRDEWRRNLQAIKHWGDNKNKDKKGLLAQTQTSKTLVTPIIPKK